MDDNLPPGLVMVPAQSQMWTKSALAIMRLQAATPRADVFCAVEPTTIAQKRNWGVSTMLGDDRYRWILFLDSDMTPPEDAVSRLWATAERAEADLVQAAMVATRPPHVPTGAKVTARGEPEDPLRPVSSDPDIEFKRPYAKSLLRLTEPLELDMVGTGCLLIRRRVFEAMEEPWFVARADGVNEDYNATLRMTDAGFKAVLDPNVEVGHLATHEHGLEDSAREYQRKEIEEEKRRLAVGITGG